MAAPPRASRWLRQHRIGALAQPQPTDRVAFFSLPFAVRYKTVIPMLVLPRLKRLSYGQRGALEPSRVGNAFSAEGLAIVTLYQHDVLRRRVSALVAVSREIREIAILRNLGSPVDCVGDQDFPGLSSSIEETEWPACRAG